MFRTKYQPRKVVTPTKAMKSLTDQQYKEDCTIEGIIKRYGVIPSPEVAPISADVSEYGDFAACMARVNDALALFNNLPSKLRERFGNDPRAYYDFVCNRENFDEAVKLGLFIPRKEEKTATELLGEIAEKLSPPKGEN